MRWDPNIRRFNAKSIAKQLINVVGRERAKPKFAYGRIGLANTVQRERERVLRSHLVVAVSTDQQQMACVAMGDEILDQSQGRGIEPLKVVDKNNQWVLLPREDVDETLEHQLKPKSGLRWRKYSHGRLRTDQANELGNKVSQKTALIADSLPNGVAPAADVFLFAAQKLANQPLEGLSQSGVRDAFKAQVELSRDEDAPR